VRNFFARDALFEAPLEMKNGGHFFRDTAVFQ
jgi:hypothetical protein